MSNLGPLQQAAQQSGIANFSKLPKRLRNDDIDYAPSRIAELLADNGFQYANQAELMRKAYEIWRVYNRLS